MAKTLELTFTAESGGEMKVSVRSAKASLTPTQIKSAMEQLIAANVFTSSKGSPVGIVGARFVERTTEDIVLP